MNNWDNYGVTTLVRKNSEKIVSVLDVMEKVGSQYHDTIDETCYREITSIRQKTGLTIGFVSDTIYLMSGTTILLEYKTKKTEISHQVSKDELQSYISNIKNHIDNVDTGNSIIVSDDNEKTPISILQTKRTIIEIAAAIDRHDAFKRYVLPNLKSTSNHVLMVDPFAVCVSTPQMIKDPIEDRIAAFKERLVKLDYLKRKYIHDDIRIIGNLVIADDKTGPIGNGVFRINGEITESQRHAMVGQKVNKLIEGHVLSTSEAIIKSIAFQRNNNDEPILNVDTNAIDPEGLIPIRFG